jgi:photosystem II stability/assembly factor-like uncharacterized protein
MRHQSTKNTTILLLFILLSLRLSSQITWKSPLDLGGSYTNGIQNDLFFPTSTDGWIAGYSGLILHTTDGGTTWGSQTSNSVETLHSVYFISPAKGWITGANGLILATTDGGEHWTPQSTGLTEAIYDVFFIDENKGWAVADGGFILNTVDGGLNWDFGFFVNDTELRAVYFNSSTEGWASGAAGKLLHTIDGGVNWTDQSFPNVYGTLSSIHFISATNGWIAGGNGIIYNTIDGGVTWNAQTSGTTENLFSVQFSSSTNGLAVGNGGIILATNDGGNTWNTLNSVTTNTLTLAFLMSPSNGILIGHNGIILKTTNGGVSWVTISEGTSLPLVAVHFSSANVGCAVGSFYGPVMMTYDGGYTWTTSSLGNINLGNFPFLNDTYFASDSKGWIIGELGTIIATSNGGQLWNTQNSGTSETLNSVFFTSELNGWVVGSAGTILKTQDGGTTWNTQNSGTGEWLDGLYFVSSNEGWVSGTNGLILHTIDGGITWTSQNYDPSISLLYSLSFVSANEGWSVGTGGTILHTSDGGVTWLAQNSGTADEIVDVHFVTPQKGWATYSQTAILTTENGGLSWVSQPMGSAIGSIHFISPTQGWGVGGLGNIMLYTCNGMQLTVNTYSSPTDPNNCLGKLAINAAGVPNYISDIDNGSTYPHSGYQLVENQCAGVHSILTSDVCANAVSSPFVIPVDSNYVFNNPFINNLAIDSLGNTIEDCDIYYNGIDTAYIDSIFANGNEVTVIWNIIDSNGSNLDTSNYILNNGNGVYYLQLSVFCPNKAIGEYFTVSEAIYFENGWVSTAGIIDLSQSPWVEIYPNPTTGFVTVNSDMNNLELRVIDAQGRLVLTEVDFHQTTISLEPFRSGVYFFQLSSERGTIVERVVKQ